MRLNHVPFHRYRWLDWSRGGGNLGGRPLSGNVAEDGIGRSGAPEVPSPEGFGIDGWVGTGGSVDVDCVGSVDGSITGSNADCKRETFNLVARFFFV
ncbi:UNVERIFIED_CONTAM: hypothetical protein K2H54_060900 [Gekko kuhli]